LLKSAAGDRVALEAPGGREYLMVLEVCYERIPVEPFREPPGAESSAKEHADTNRSEKGWRRGSYKFQAASQQDAEKGVSPPFARFVRHGPPGALRRVSMTRCVGQAEDRAILTVVGQTRMNTLHTPASCMRVDRIDARRIARFPQHGSCIPAIFHPGSCGSSHVEQLY